MKDHVQIWAPYLKAESKEVDLERVGKLCFECRNLNLMPRG